MMCKCDFPNYVLNTQKWVCKYPKKKKFANCNDINIQSKPVDSEFTKLFRHMDKARFMLGREFYEFPLLTFL